jgi:endonuclease-3
MIKYKEVLEYLDELFPTAKCELNYTRDYELLIATVLSAQCTDKRVNQVTKILFSKYDLFELDAVDIKKIESIIYPVGTYTKKAQYIKGIAHELIKKYDGKVPNDRAFLESLPGVGRKTCNVVLSNLYNEPAIAVDTHVARVANRLGIVSTTDVLKIEEKLMAYFPKDKWSRVVLPKVWV